MRAQEGWTIPDRPGLDDLQADTVAVSVERDSQELRQRDDKELRGIAILERDQEPAAPEDAALAVIDGQEAFRRRFGLKNVNLLAALLARL